MQHSLGGSDGCGSLGNGCGDGRLESDSGGGSIRCTAVELLGRLALLLCGLNASTHPLNVSHTVSPGSPAAGLRNDCRGYQRCRVDLGGRVLAGLVRLANVGSAGAGGRDGLGGVNEFPGGGDLCSCHGLGGCGSDCLGGDSLDLLGRSAGHGDGREGTDSDSVGRGGDISLSDGRRSDDRHGHCWSEGGGDLWADSQVEI